MFHSSFHTELACRTSSGTLINRPVSAEAYDDFLSCVDLPPLGAFAETGAPLSPGCGTSFTSSRSALGTSPKARRSRKKTELHNVDTMGTTMTKSTKFVLGLEQSAYVPRKSRVMHGAGRAKKAIAKKVLRPCLRCVVLDCWSLHLISRYFLILVCCRVTRLSVRRARAVRQRRLFVTTPLLRLRMAVICRLSLKMIAGSIMLLPLIHPPRSSWRRRLMRALVVRLGTTLGRRWGWFPAPISRMSQRSVRSRQRYLSTTSVFPWLVWSCRRLLGLSWISASPQDSLSSADVCTSSCWLSEGRWYLLFWILLCSIKFSSSICKLFHLTLIWGTFLALWSLVCLFRDIDRRYHWPFCRQFSISLRRLSTFMILHTFHG